MFRDERACGRSESMPVMDGEEVWMRFGERRAVCRRAARSTVISAIPRMEDEYDIECRLTPYDAVLRP